MSQINSYTNESEILNLIPRTGDLVLNEESSTIYLCINADASGLSRWRLFTNDSV